MSLWSADTLVQFSPESSDTNKPPFSCLESLSMSATTLEGLALDTAMAIFPFSSGRPFSNKVQCAPPSTVLYKPLPTPPLTTCQGNLWCSHIAAYNTSGFCISIDNSAAPLRLFTKSCFFQFLPPSVVL